MLLYKNYLLQKINSGKGMFYNSVAYHYVSELGLKPKDDYEAVMMLYHLDDKKYCGEGYESTATYFLMDRQENLYWFKHMKDMMMFAGGDPEWSVYSFYKFRRHWYNDFMFLMPEDIFELDNILIGKQGVYCETKDIGFEDIDEAAMWLYHGGYASTAENAKKQLTKHLDGQTALCYKMKFIKY